MRGLATIGLIGILLTGCGGSTAPAPSEATASREVVAYVALDREFSEPILESFSGRSGIDVKAKYDVESTKTVGLTTLLIAEATTPRCDLFWNNEILNTLRLKKRGMLAEWTLPNAADYPEGYRDKGGAWYGFAARARVLIVNTKAIPATKDRPTSIHDLADPTWKGKTGIAKPLAGTTATHAACLFAVLGDVKAKEFFAAIKANDVKVLSGNKQVALDVGAGRLAFGLTDTDDAIAEVDAGRPVAIIYPDRRDAQMGTLFIPNTIAILKGAPHRKAAESLAIHLLSPVVEETLSRGPSAQIPLNSRVAPTMRVETPKTIHAMAVDFEAAAEKWNTVAAYIAAEFGGPTP